MSVDMSQLTDTFTSIADAIREKTGSTSAFTPAQMITEIENIPTGGVASYIFPYTYANSTITSYTGSENLILDNAFYSCSNLSTVSFPQCGYIGNRAFNGCNSLSDISFPNVSYIGSFAFAGCSSLSNISFPECSYIGSFAFAECTSLSNISFPECSYIGGYAFNRCIGLTNILFPKCSYIGDYAFERCSSLTNISFPICSYIGGYAFADCTSLSSLYLLSTSVVYLAHSNAFNETPLSATGTGNIYVPSSLYNDYITTNKWSYLSNRITSYNI